MSDIAALTARIEKLEHELAIQQDIHQIRRIQYTYGYFIDKKVREAFETWVDPGYIQHNPLAETGRDAAIKFLEPFFASHPDIHYTIARIIADGNLVAVHSHGVFTAGERGLAIVDILRVEGCKVMEHWDVAQPVPEKSANTNGMF